jgi:hypothetical protein
MPEIQRPPSRRHPRPQAELRACVEDLYYACEAVEKAWGGIRGDLLGKAGCAAYEQVCDALERARGPRRERK